MLQTKFQCHWFWRSRFEGFYYKWAWWPCCSYDPDRLINFCFLCALKTVHEISLQSAQWFQRSRSKCGRTLVGQTTELFYSLSLPPHPEAFSSGELKACKAISKRKIISGCLLAPGLVKVMFYNLRHLFSLSFFLATPITVIWGYKPCHVTYLQYKLSKH